MILIDALIHNHVLKYLFITKESLFVILIIIKIAMDLLIVLIIVIIDFY